MLRLKAEREAAQRAEEEAFRQSMMAKFAEDDRLEQLNAQKRRLKVHAYMAPNAMVLLQQLYNCMSCDHACIASCESSCLWHKPLVMAVQSIL
jgi:hypothetical protein